MNWTREDFEDDRRRYTAAIAALLENGYAEEHPLVQRQRRRVFIIDRVLNDPAFGLTQQEKP